MHKNLEGEEFKANACVSWLLKFSIGSIALNGLHSGINKFEFSNKDGKSELIRSAIKLW